MATAAEVQTKAAEFAEAVEAMEAAKAQYELAHGPYLEAKKAYAESIAHVGALDKELESLSKDYEPPAAPV